jgi:hypothetical protein
MLVVFKKDIRAQEIKTALHLNSNGHAPELRFEWCYNKSYEFFYNDFYSDRLDRSYVGHRSVLIEDFRQLGEMHFDFVLVKNKVLDVNSLHIHLNLPKFTLDMSRQDGAEFLTLKSFLNRLYKYFESGQTGIDLLDALPELCTSGPKREYTYSLSRYMYVSVANLQKDELEKWKEYATSIYGILYGHAKGISKDIAEEYLDKHVWATTYFSKNFYQPGFLVSLSTPYPKKIYFANIDWFLTGTTSGDETTIVSPPSRTQPYEDYDLLPEYPPLRYLGLLSLEFAGFVEENFRYVYNELLDIDKKGWRSEITIPFRLSRLSRLCYKTKNLDYLRLPVTREYVSLLIDNKIQEDIESNITAMRGDYLNIVMLALTVGGLVLALVAVLIQFTR